MAQKAKTQISLSYSSVYWASGFFRNITTTIIQNDLSIITDKTFNVENFIEICQKYNVTSVMIPPSTLAVLLNSEKFLSTDISTLNNFMIVGAILSVALRKKFEQKFPNKNLTIAYGMTEASATMTAPMEYKKDFSVGSIIIPNTSIKIVDEDGKSLDNGQSGEICIKMFFKFLVSKV